VRINARKRIRIGIAALILVLPLLVAIDRLEPFAKRVQGRTARQWVKGFAAAKQIDPRIVDSFKTTATPKLAGIIQAGRRGSYIRGIVREAIGVSIPGGDIDNPIMLAAGGWLALLNADGYALELPDDPSLGLWLDQYDDRFYAPRFAQLALTTRQQAATLVNDIPVPELKPHEKVAIGAKVQPAKVYAGQHPWLFVKLRIAPGHHIYALQKSLNSAVPTIVEVTLPAGAKLEGAWAHPAPEKMGGALIYRKEVVLPNRLVLSKVLKPGKYKAQIKVSFQVCNEALCWPPESQVTEVEFELVKDAVDK
jgi:hypothetical protein